MKVSFLLAFVMCSFASTNCIAAEPASKLPTGFTVWTAKELRDAEKPLHASVGGPAKNANIKFDDYGESATQIGRREGNGLAEWHAHLDDYFVVQSGEATLVIGGEIVNPRDTDAGEIRGDSIKGGERRKLAAGDIVHIPSRMPHWVLVEEGKHLTYFLIKVKTP